MLKYIQTILFLFILILAQAKTTPVEKKMIWSGLSELLDSSSVNIDSLMTHNHLETPTNLIDLPAFNGDNPLDFLDDMSEIKDAYTAKETTNLDKARIALQLVKDGAKFVQKLDGSTLIDLPQGLTKDFGGTKISIVLNAIRIYPEYAALEVFVEVKRPDWPTPLMFYSPSIRYTQKGGLSGLSSVGLLGNMAIPMEEGKSMLVLERGIYNPQKRKFEGGTYLQFDCDGFAGMGLKGHVAFSKEWLLRITPEGKIDTLNRVMGYFDMEVADINNIILDISIDEFIVPQSDRISWKIEHAILDFSETEKRFDFPIPDSGYDPIGNGYLTNTEMWTGVYIEEFSMRWLDTLAANQSSSFGIQGYDLLIDNNGFTGYVQVTGLLPIAQGDLDGWNFSIDKLGVEVIMNQPTEFNIEGVMVVPLLANDEEGENAGSHSDRLMYGGHFDFEHRRYSLTVGLTENKEFEVKMLKGGATIYANSRLKLEYLEDEGFGIEATLHGDFAIENAMIGGKKLSLPTVSFDSIIICSQKSYIRKIGNWGLPQDVGSNFLGFGYNAKALEISGQDEDAEFRVVADINFAAKGGVAISAGGAFRIKGKVELDDNTQKQKYNYKTLKVDMIFVEADLKAVQFSGSIIFFRDNDKWGTGFQGKLELYIKGANEKKGDEPGTGIAALALFGTKDDGNGGSYRYFMVDMLARLGAGISIPNTGINLKGIGGGVYYHMNQLSCTQNIEDKEFDPGDPIAQPDAYEQWMLAQIGTSLSGTKYVPDKDVLFGVNATVVIALDGEEEAFNANITFTIQMNTSYGIDFIRIKGVANFMAPISWNSPSCTGVSAAIEMNFVFQEKDGIQPGFYASAHVFINIAEGNFVLMRGKSGNANAPQEYIEQMEKTCDANEIHYAGGLEIEMTKGSWFMNMGTPSQRIAAGAKLTTSMVDLSAYIDIGTNIPSFPPLPANVAHLTNLGNMNEEGRATGNGFAFGATFDMDLLNIKYTVFTAVLGLEAGFDIMLKQYDPIYCANNNGEPLGVEYWYAMGQAYAFIEGDVKGFGFTLLDLALAAAIQFKGPKPFFGKGAVAGHYKVGPNGWLTGNCYFEFEFGEECETEEDMETSYDLVSMIKPNNDEENVRVDKDIFVSFNYPLDEDFVDVDEEGSLVYYQLKLDEFSIESQSGVQVEGEFVNESYYVTFIPNDMLLPQETYTVSIHASFENTQTGEIVAEEIVENVFTTDISLDYIPESNVAYTYPFNGQYNYYKNGPSSTKTIKLKKGQGELFSDEVTHLVRLTSSYPAYLAYQSLTYHENSNSIIFSLPNDLLNGQAYKVEVVEFVYEEGGGSSNNGNNNSQNNQEMNGPLGNNSQDSLSGPSNNHFLPGDDLPELEFNETSLYKMFFRVSLYNDPKSKYDSLEFGNMNGRDIPVELVLEPMGYEELIGFYDFEPSIRVAADVDETDWYQKYANYQTNNGVIEPYTSNSGRTDYSIAIKDNLQPQRRMIFGDGNPYEAILLTQKNLEDFIVSDNNLSLINQSNQQGILHLVGEIDMRYLLDSIAWGDISYFINESIQEVNWLQVVKNAESRITVWKIDMEENQENIENCSNINECCLHHNEAYEIIKDEFDKKLNQTNDIFEGSYFYNEVRYHACNNLLLTNIEDNSDKFLMHDLKNYNLENGDYPIYFRYKHPISGEKVYSKNYTIQK